MKAIDLATAKKLLREERKEMMRGESRFQTPQGGPLRRYDREMQCLSPYTYSGKGNCRSPTYYKLDGIPTCTTHALKGLNQMVMELTTRLLAVQTRA